MRMFLFIACFVSLFFVHTVSQAAILAAPEKLRTAIETAGKPGAYEDETCLGIYNKNAGVLFDKKTGNMVGIYDSKGITAAANVTPAGDTICSLWQIDIMLPNAEQPLSAEAKNFAPSAIKTSSDKSSATVTLQYANVTIGQYSFSIEAQATLTDDDPKVNWKISVPNNRKNAFSIWSVMYPVVAVPAFDGGSNNRVVIPYRRGVLRDYGPQSPRSISSFPYPGPAAKFQFMAAYGNISRRGMYYAIEDGEGYSKNICCANEPRYNSLILKVEHLPADRGVAGTGFASPYAVVTSPFSGDWWNAARIYREWWTRQVWASQGLLQDRKDVPDWVKNTPVCVRFSTSKPARTIENNVLGGIALSEAIGGKPYFGIWYAPFGEKPGMQTAGLIATGHGHVLPVCREVQDALKTMGERHVYFMAYLQSIIYDSHFKGLPPEEKKSADDNVSRNRKGEKGYYGVEKEESGQYAMCRATDWWQDRFIEMSVVAVKNGFRGIYFDSFGKGENECFATNHGHCIGGGNKVIVSQRKMARRVLDAIRKIDPQAIISGEAPIEAFRDLITVNLYALNSYAYYVPIFRTVWGDYGLGYGRNISIAVDAKDIIPEMARLFVDGTVLGRFFCEGGDEAWNGPQYGVQKRYVQKASNYTAAGLDYLRFGEYLHPLELKVPFITYTESAEKNKVTAPAVLNSVTRSHRDGSVAIVFANISDKSARFNVAIDADLRGEELKKSPAVLYQMNEKGELTKIAEGQHAAKQFVRIEPYDIAFFVLK